jgi:hypothetical protein
VCGGRSGTRTPDLFRVKAGALIKSTTYSMVRELPSTSKYLKARGGWKRVGLKLGLVRTGERLLIPKGLLAISSLPKRASGLAPSCFAPAQSARIRSVDRNTITCGASADHDGTQPDTEAGV